jgi:hypothetical protein
VIPQRDTPEAHPFTRQVTISIIYQQATCQSPANPLSLIDTVRQNTDFFHDTGFLFNIGQNALNMLLIRAGFYCVNPTAGTGENELLKKIHCPLQNYPLSSRKFFRVPALSFAHR